MAEERGQRVHERWAQLRFSVVGQLLAAPPQKGTLRAALAELAAREWRHPATGAPVHFGVSTLERWYYRALREQKDPVGVLRRKRRQDAGRRRALSDATVEALLAQYGAYPHWSAQLHYDNLAAMIAGRPELGPPPSYSTVRRFLRSRGLDKRRRRRAADVHVRREVRSFEAEYVGGLWHYDIHHGSRKVLTQRGEWQTPKLLGVLDDRSRLACHLQWYLGETADVVAHGLSQAFMKRGLPRAIMSDNGAAMTAAEIVQGLGRLGVLVQTTLPYSPHQNGKQEAFWGPVEGRLIAMLNGVVDLRLALLNQLTQAWVEDDYNRKVHSETGAAPLDRFLDGPSVMRPPPDSATLKLAFTRAERRTQRRSDGTILVAGRRFEVPGQYRHLAELEIRYASWDLAHVHLVDGNTGAVLGRLFPQDKTKNADALRAALDPGPIPATPAGGLPPLLARMLDARARRGLPPAYLTKDEEDAS